MDNLELFIDFVTAVKVYIADLKEELVEALSDDAADNETIVRAEADAATAREELEIWKTEVGQKSSDLDQAIANAKTDIISTSA